jgi:hypothetical protein
MGDNLHYFDTDSKQAAVYFKGSAGTAKGLLLPLLKTSHPQYISSAKKALQALDDQFFDYNKVETAKNEYLNLKMKRGQTYLLFRNTFRKLATDAEISQDRWFDDLCNKITPTLKSDIKAKKYELNKSFHDLDAYLQVMDRENNHIASELAIQKAKAVAVAFNTPRDPRGILKKDNWRARSPEPPSPTSSDQSRRNSYDGKRTRLPVRERPTSPTPAEAAPRPCYQCNKVGYFANKCPTLTDKTVAAVAEAKEWKEDKMSENS